MKSKFLSFVGDKAFVTFAGIVILFLCVCSLIGFGFYAITTGKSLESAGLIITFLTGTVTGLIGYWWGTSAGSKEKDNAIHAMLQNSQPTILTPLMGETLTTTTTLP